MKYSSSINLISLFIRISILTSTKLYNKFSVILENHLPFNLCNKFVNLKKSMILKSTFVGIFLHKKWNTPNSLSLLSVSFKKYNDFLHFLILMTQEEKSINFTSLLCCILNLIIIYKDSLLATKLYKKHIKSEKLTVNLKQNKKIYEDNLIRYVFRKSLKYY